VSDKQSKIDFDGRLVNIMRKARWLAPWKDSFKRPVIYHCVMRVVDRKFVDEVFRSARERFGPKRKTGVRMCEEREALQTG